MSAKAWERRRRNKYLRKYMTKIERHPDWVFLLHGNMMMMSLPMHDRMSSGDLTWVDDVRIWEIDPR